MAMTMAMVILAVIEMVLISDNGVGDEYDGGDNEHYVIVYGCDKVNILLPSLSDAREEECVQTASGGGVCADGEREEVCCAACIS